MSFSINKVKESFGILSTPEIYTTAAIKRFPGAFSMGTSQRSPLFTGDQSLPGPGTYNVTATKSALPKWKFSTSQRTTFSADQNPSPMEYTTSNSIGKGSPLFSFGTKTPAKNEHENIGPGSYNPQLPPSKFYPAFSFGYKFSSDIENRNPGPGTYPVDEKEKLKIAKKEKTLPKINSENQIRTQKNAKVEGYLPKKKTQKKDLGFSTSNRDDFYNKSYKSIPGPGAYDANYNASVPERPSYKFIYGPKGSTDKAITEPGPGHFSVNEEFLYSRSPKFTISGKFKNLMEENISARNNPGPGAYNPKMKDKIPDLRFQKASKNYNYSNENPGPGYYDVEPPILKTSQGISFSTGKRINLSKNNGEPGPGHYDIVSKNEGPKVPILGRHEQSMENITPGPGKYNLSLEEQKTKTKGSMMSKTKKGTAYIKNANTPGPGNYQVDSSIDENGPKYTFGSSIQKKVWKKLYEPGPGAYDIPSTIAGIPNYLLNNTIQNVKGSEESKYSEYIKEINQSIGPAGESYRE